MRGAKLVSRFITGIWRRYLSELTYRLVMINGQTGLVGYADGRAVWALAIETDGARILAAYALINPDKLGGISSEHSS